MRPPKVKPDFDENSNEVKACLIAYGQIRDMEEMKLVAAMAGSGKKLWG